MLKEIIRYLNLNVKHYLFARKTCNYLTFPIIMWSKMDFGLLGKMEISWRGKDSLSESTSIISFP